MTQLLKLSENRSASADLCKRVEEVSLNAWPALKHLFYDGWLLRFTEGYTKRGNSIYVLNSSAFDMNTKIAHCERYYQEQNQIPLFRLSTLYSTPALESLLERVGYHTIEPTRVMYFDLNNYFHKQPRPNSEFYSQVAGIWLQHYYQAGKFSYDRFDVHHRIIKTILPRILLAELNYKGTLVSMGMAVLDQNLIGLYDILTLQGIRNHGFGTELVRELLEWGRVNEAHGAYLQVSEANKPAIHLYEKIGFKTLYRYWYKIKNGKQMNQIGKVIPAYDNT